MNRKAKSSHSSAVLNQKQRQPNRKTVNALAKKSRIEIVSFNHSTSGKKTRKQSSNSTNSPPTPHKQRIVPQRRRKKRSKKPIIPTPLKIVIRLAVITVGISTLLGSAMSIANSFNTGIDSPVAVIPETTAEHQQQLEKTFSLVTLAEPLDDLKTKVQNLIAQYPKLQAEVFIVDLDQKNYLSLQSAESISAASTIKLPVLIAFFQDVDAGKIDLQEKLTMTKELKAGGSGGMQYQETGRKYSALYTANQMMVTSDNTATNMIIHRLGGQEKLNQRFAEWGLNVTKLRNPLPDLTGTNTTSAEELGMLLIKIERGELVSLRSRDRMLEIMSKVKTNTLLPQGLERGATIAHKTGDIGSVLGDVGMIDMPNGKRYVASVFVKRPRNDPQARTLIQKISQVTYQHFKLNPSRSFLEED
ncbi:MAG: serine hydrolase [Xenococcaceae cyanobacterium MO_167.B27]|nr:serine hydrolase [Xenococcaceae cyanobacterium MO_167.B27]